MNQDISINGTNFNIDANSKLTETEFTALHEKTLGSKAEAVKAHKAIKEAAAVAAKAATGE